jgi:multiple sugar transport system substrate-binding protein
MTKVVDYFNTTYSQKVCVTAELEFFGRDQLFTKQEAIMAAGTDQVDAWFITSRSLGKYGKFLDPIEPYLNDTTVNTWGGTKDHFIKSSTDGLTNLDGKLVGIPMDISANFLIYRKDFMDKLLSDPTWQATYKKISLAQMGKDMTPKDPDQWTWDDFLATSYFFTKKYNPDSPTEYGNYTAGKVMPADAYLWSNVYYDYGGSWFDNNGNPTFDNQAFRDALQIWKTMFTNGLTPPGSANGEYPETSAAITAGQVAMSVDWNAAYNDLNASTSAVSGKLAVVAPPAGPAGRFVHNHTMALALNVNSTHKAETMRFMTWLFTDEASKLYAENGGIPPVASVLTGMSDAHPDYKWMSDYVAAYGKSPAPYAGIIELMVSQYLAQGYTGQLSIDDTAKQLQAAAVAEMAKYK